MGDQEETVPLILKNIIIASQHKLPYGLMERLNYHDLKAIIIELNIKDYEQEKARRTKEKGRRKATEEEVASMHGF